MFKRYLIVIIFSVLVIGCAQMPPAAEARHQGVAFAFSAPSASSVAIAGSFNQWDPKRDQLSGPDKKGRWKIALPLPAGRYEYLFVINGNEWALDPSALKMDDGLGAETSLIVVSP